MNKQGEHGIGWTKLRLPDGRVLVGFTWNAAGGCLHFLANGCHFCHEELPINPYGRDGHQYCDVNCWEYAQEGDGS